MQSCMRSTVYERYMGERCMKCVDNNIICPVYGNAQQQSFFPVKKRESNTQDKALNQKRYRFRSVA